MAIQVVLRGGLNVYLKNTYKNIYRKYRREGENDLLYTSNERMKVRDLLENIGLSIQIVSFVLINNKRYTLTNDLLNMVLTDGDCIEIFPQIIGG